MVSTRPRSTELWALVHAERAALASDLQNLTDEQWSTPSLCTGFTVRDVLAHLTSAASLTPLRWMAGVLRCRFDFDQQVAMRLAELLGATPGETLERFRGVVTSTTAPPLPTIGMLGETIVHGDPGPDRAARRSAAPWTVTGSTPCARSRPVERVSAASRRSRTRCRPGRGR